MKVVMNVVKLNIEFENFDIIHVKLPKINLNKLPPVDKTLCISYELPSIVIPLYTTAL